MPKISVIVPVYKVERYLDRCVESVLAQTFTDFELILVDDGSPDNCPQMCDEWVKKDNRVRVLHKTNNGVSAARNDGVKLSNAEYVTFVDSDDWIYPNCLSILYENLIKYNADVSIGRIYKNNREIVFSKQIIALSGREAVCFYGRIDDERYRCCHAKMVKRKIALNRLFPVDRSYSEDMATIYKWYFDSSVVVGVDESVYHYNVNETSISNQPYGLHRLGDLITWEEMLSFLKKEKLDELFDFKLKEYAYELCYQYVQLKDINRNDLARKVRSRLLEIYNTTDIITIKKMPDVMEKLFPFRMHVYWTIKGILNKFKKR